MRTVNVVLCRRSGFAARGVAENAGLLQTGDETSEGTFQRHSHSQRGVYYKLYVWNIAQITSFFVAPIHSVI